MYIYILICVCIYIYLHSRIFLHRGSKRLFWPEFLLPQDLVTQLPEVATEAGNFRALGFLWNLYGILKDILGFGFYVFFFDFVWFSGIFWDFYGICLAFYYQSWKHFSALFLGLLWAPNRCRNTSNCHENIVGFYFSIFLGLIAWDKPRYKIYQDIGT